MNSPSTYQLLREHLRGCPSCSQGRRVRQQEGEKSAQLFLKEDRGELLCVVSMRQLLPLLRLFSNIFRELVQVQITGGFIVREEISSLLTWWLLRSRPFCPHRRTGPAMSWWGPALWHHSSFFFLQEAGYQGLAFRSSNFFLS